MQGSQGRLEELIIKLREEGYRLTPQRMAVIKTLVGNREHLSAEQIYERVKVDFPMTSLATIYKTVSVLKEMDELLEISINGDSTHYDGGSPHPHPHVICTRCGRIIDIDMDAGVADMTPLPLEVAQKTGFRIESHRLDFFGICPQCQGEE